MGEGKRVERVADIMMVIDEREKDVAATQVLDVFPGVSYSLTGSHQFLTGLLERTSRRVVTR